MDTETPASVSLRQRLRYCPLFARLCSRLFGYTSKMRGSRNRIDTCNSIVTRSSIEIYGNDCEVILGQRARLWDCSITVTGNRCRLHIGDRCSLRGVRLVVEDEGSLLRLGNETSMTQAYVIAQEGHVIDIGEDCMVSQQAIIRSGDGHSILERASGRRLNHAGPIRLEKHVWIGSGALVFGDSEVRTGAIVGAGALVKKNVVPAHSIVVGRPAKVIRNGITWERERLAPSSAPELDSQLAEVAHVDATLR